MDRIEVWHLEIHGRDVHKIHDDTAIWKMMLVTCECLMNDGLVVFDDGDTTGIEYRIEDGTYKWC